VFKNFLYEFNTFIELNEWGSTVSISSTTFDRMSNCGSIIRNTKHFISPETFNSTSFHLYVNNSVKTDMYTRNEDEIANIDSYFQTGETNPLSLSCTTSSSNQELP
jgi:hypothetical protein